MKNWLRYIGSLVGAALLIRLLFGLGVVDTMPLMSDAVSYDEGAREMLRVFPGEEAYYWPPGLPVLLAGWYSVFGMGIDVARCFAIVVSTTNVVLVYELARQVLPNEQTARWAGGIMAVYPPSVMMTSQVLSQPVEMTALLGATIFLLVGLRRSHWVWFVGAGFAFGVGILVRPSLLSVVLLLLVVLGAWLYWMIRNRSAFSLQPVLGAGLGLLLLVGMLAPVVVHNHAHGGGWTLSTNNQYNLLLGNNPHTPLYKTSHLASKSPDEFPEEVLSVYQRASEREGPSRQMIMQEVAGYVLEHPGTFLLRTLNRMRAFWGFDYVTSRRIQIAYGLGWGALCGLLTLEAGGYLIVMLLVLLAGVAGRNWLNWKMKLLGWVIIGYQIPYWIAFSTGTYHYSVVGLLIPLAALGARILWDWFRGTRRIKSTRKLAVFITVFLSIQIEYAYFMYIYM